MQNCRKFELICGKNLKDGHLNIIRLYFNSVSCEGDITMKKICAFSVLALITLIIFACTIPSSIEIKGTPSFELAVDMDFSDMFSEMMEGAFGSDDNELKVLECTHSSLSEKTFLIYMNILEDDLASDINGSSLNSLSDKDPISSDFTLVSTKEKPTLLELDPITLPISGFGDFLDGFKFDEDKIKSNIYISSSDSDIAESIGIKLKFNSGSEKTSDNSTGKSSGISSSADKYEKDDIPADGLFSSKDVFPPELLNDHDPMDIDFTIYLKNGEEFNTEWLTKADIKVELVIWIPLIFEPDEDDGKLTTVNGEKGAELKLPGLEALGSFISDLPELIKSLDLAIGMNTNPFQDGSLVIRNDNNVFNHNKLIDNKLHFSFKEDEIKKINEMETFEPEFSIFIPKGKNLKIPRDFRIVTFSLGAEIDLVIELGGEK
jgi:hypothetical protein